MGPNNGTKRLLFLGEIDPGQTALMRMRAFLRLGFNVRGVNTVHPWRDASWVKRQMQRRLQRGSIVQRINRLVLEAAIEHKPSIIWAEKQEFLSVETVEALKRVGARLIHFTPDPYFSLHWKRTRTMDAALPHFDALVYCKSYERSDYAAAGPQTIYMPLGYCDEVHRPTPSCDPLWRAAIGFVGGWEPRRERLVSAVAEANLELKIWGSYWDFLVDGRWTPRRAIILRQLAGNDSFKFYKQPAVAAALQGGEVYGIDYARALSSSRIQLGFLRQVCPDQHTTRTFEIPACGSMLLADRTQEHLAFFDEGREAEYFDSGDELVDKARFFAANEASRSRIAQAGKARGERSRYAYKHRLADALGALGLKTGT